MSKSRMLLTIVSLLTLLVIIFFINGAVTLKEENDKYRDKVMELKDKNKVLTESNMILETDNWDLKDTLDRMQTEVDNLEKSVKDKEKDIKSLKEKNKSLKDSNSSLKSQLQAKVDKDNTLSSASRGNVSSGRQVQVEATAYVALCDTGCTGVTATGINLLENPDVKVISVDPSIIPLGSKVHVEGYGYAVAGDTGGAIKGHKIDLLVRSISEAKEWGRRSVTVSILE